MTGLFEDSNQTEFVLNSCILTLLASLGTLGAMDPFDDTYDVLELLCFTGHIKNGAFSYLIMFFGRLSCQIQASYGLIIHTFSRHQSINLL